MNLDNQRCYHASNGMPQKLRALFLQGFLLWIKCERTFINVTCVFDDVERGKEGDNVKKEEPYFKFLYFEKWWRCICVQDLGRVSINHFLPQNLCNYFCIGYANTGLIKTGMKIFWILFVFWVIMMRENLRIYQFAL